MGFEKKKDGVLIRFIDLGIAVLSMLALVAGLFACLAPHVHPENGWIFAYAGLAAPVIYMVNLFLALYWVLRWKIIVILPVITLLIGMPKVKLFVRLAKPQVETVNSAYQEVKILTYNVEGFLDYDSDAKRTLSTATGIIDFFKAENPDIICIQEFQSTQSVPESTLSQWLSDWPYKKINYTISGSKGGVWGSAIYSKFPIIAQGKIVFEESRNGAHWAEVVTPKKDTLRIICNHLETTYVDKSNVAFLQLENFANEPDKSEKIRQIAGRLHKGFKKRAAQADTIKNLIGSSNVPTIVCGDFNDPPMSYSYRTIRGQYADAFVDKGHGYGYTYKHLYKLMRIDYIFHSPHLETLSYNTPDAPWSDHRPVVATFRINKE